MLLVETEGEGGDLTLTQTPTSDPNPNPNPNLNPNPNQVAGLVASGAELCATRGATGDYARGRDGAAGLRDPTQFVGHSTSQNGAETSLLLTHNGLHVELVVRP